MAIVNPIPPAPAGWKEEEWRAYVKTMTGKDIFAMTKLGHAEVHGGLIGLFTAHLIAISDRVVGTLDAALGALTGPMVVLSGRVMKRITGVDVDPNEITNLVIEGPGRNQAMGIGKQFTPVVDNIFDVEAAKRDAATRNEYQGARDNIGAFFGTNLLWQLRSLAIGTVSSFVPHFQLRHLEGLHQTVSWAFGFGWLSWSVMSAIMDVTTTQKLKQYYLSQVKPNDLTEQRAIQAFLAGLLDGTTLNQIMDNEGLRDDVRDISIALQEKDLSDSELTTLWWGQQITEPQLLEQMRLKAFGPNKAQTKVDLIKVKREQDIRDQYVDVQRSLFRDCVIDEVELRGVLQAELFTATEQDWIVKVELAKRRQRQFMGTTDMFKAVKLGIMDLNQAIQSLECRGWTYDDAVAEALLRLQDHLPDCDNAKLKDKALIALLQALGTGVGINQKLLNTNILKYLACLDPAFVLVPPVVTFEVQPERVIDQGYVTLKWTSLFATRAHITPTIGPVPVNGDTQVQVKHTQGFTFVAENIVGKTSATVTVFVDPAPPLPTT